MISVLPMALALAVTGQATDTPQSWKTEMTEPLSGPDFLLIAEAYKHPEMRGRDLSCYRIRVFRERGVRTVAFLGVRPPVRYVSGAEQDAIIYPGPNPRCPSKSFVMTKSGKVGQVIFARH